MCGRLRSTEVRLLTLTGPGGTGKTRVSLQVAAELTDEYRGRGVLRPLAAIADPSLVAPTVARTLGLIEGSTSHPRSCSKATCATGTCCWCWTTSSRYSRRHRSWTKSALRRSQRKVLVTSRTPLGLYGEHEFPIPPLSLPEPEALPPSAEHLADYGAIRLFLERARAVKPEFSLTEENAPAVAEICERLDGLPLAIELAAARMKLLPPQALLSRLGNRLKLLTGGARNLPERQRTLRNTIEWSYGMLDEGEKMLFARLAVFSGGGTLEAIEAVCDAEGDLPVDRSKASPRFWTRACCGKRRTRRRAALRNARDHPRVRAGEARGERGRRSRRACPRRILSWPWRNRPSPGCGGRRMRRGWTRWNKSTTT